MLESGFKPGSHQPKKKKKKNSKRTSPALRSHQNSSRHEKRDKNQHFSLQSISSESPCSNLAVKIHAANEENNSFLLLEQKNNCLFFSKCESHTKKVPSKTLSAACGHCFRFLFTFHKVTRALLFAANWTQNYSGAPEIKYMARRYVTQLRRL